eukprot:XP_001703336.1 predicted protein [Chlamydomonas reinhardtii]
MACGGWLLADTGELSPLLPGTCPSDVLESGPTFELALRSCPPAKLVYGHVPSANVNAAASRIAGHAVKGDACLVLSALTVASTSGGASCSTAAAAPLPPPSLDLLLDSLMGGTRLAQALLANPRHPNSGRNALTKGAAAAAADSSDGSRAPPAEGQATGAAAAVVAGVLGRAPSWEAPLSPPCKSARNSLESPPHPLHLPRAQHRPAHPVHSLASALAAAVASGDGIARPASPGVSRLASQLAGSWLGSGSGGGGGAGTSSGAHGSLQHAAAEVEAFSQAAHKRRHSGESGEVPLASCTAPAGAAAVTAARMELDEGAPAAAELPGREIPLAGSTQRRSLQQARPEEQEKDKELQSPAPALPAPQEHEQEVPWRELPCDVVAYVATQLPQQASQAIAMAGVCRGWRVALLANLPALRRITFNLDPTNHLRTSTHTRSGTAGANGGDAKGSSSGAAADGSATANSTGGAGVGAGACVGLRRRSVARSAGGGADQQRSEEEHAMAAALSRQYGAGAFVLPSAHTAAGGLEGMEGAELFGGGGVEQQEAQEEQEAQEPVVPRAAARRPPALLLEAARGASNPSAQLVMAQLLEGSGDADGSLRWWRKLAIAGDVMGMFKLGMACYDGSHGMQPDPEAAHMWLSRAVRHILQVDSITAIQLDEQHGGSGPGGGAPAAAPAGGAGVAGAAGGGAASAAGGAGGQPRVSLRMRRKLASLDPTLLRMLGWSSIVLGYLEFDGVAGRSVWGMGDRSEAVRLFRLAEGCGCNEAAAVLGWLYNTGQY